MRLHNGRKARLRAWVKRVLSTAHRVAKDVRLPRWLRLLFVFGLLPIPFCLDEIALLFATAVLFIVHRPILREAWAATA